MKVMKIQLYVKRKEGLENGGVGHFALIIQFRYTCCAPLYSTRVLYCTSTLQLSFLVQSLTGGEASATPCIPPTLVLCHIPPISTQRGNKLLPLYESLYFLMFIIGLCSSGSVSAEIRGGHSIAPKSTSANAASASP